MDYYEKRTFFCKLFTFGLLLLSCTNEYDELALEKDSKKEEKVTVETNDTIQIDFAMIEKEAFLKEIASIEIMTMTPLAAMNKLFEIVQKSKNM